MLIDKKQTDFSLQEIKRIFLVNDIDLEIRTETGIQFGVKKKDQILKKPK